MWIKPIAEAGTPALDFLCIPWAGAGPEVFFPWRNGLPRGVSLSAIHLPGRSSRYREPLLHSTEEMVESVVGALLARSTSPVVIFGHSFGAILAFEISRRLEQVGRGPRRLAVSGSPGPGAIAGREKVAHLPTEDLIARVRRCGGFAPEILANPSFLDIYVPILWADLGSLEAYTFEDSHPLACPILVLSGQTDPLVAVPKLDAWSALTSAHCSYQLFDGGHFFFQGRERCIVDMILDH